MVSTPDTLVSEGSGEYRARGLVQALASTVTDHAQPFREMVARIERALDDPSEFGGAIVIMPPQGDPLAWNTNGPKPDLLQFWNAVKVAIEQRVTEIVNEAQARDPWRR